MTSSKRSWTPSLMALAAMAALPSIAMAQTVVRDAATGQLRAPTAAEAAELARQGAGGAKAGARASSAAATVKARKMPHGGTSVVLGEAHMIYSVARVGENGAVERECVTGEDAAEKAMQAPARFAAPIKPAMTTARGASYELK